MADTVIENLITQLSFEIDEEKLEKFDEFIGNAVKGLTAMVAAASAAAAGIFLFTKKIAESNDELGKFAKRTGIDVQALQELGFAAELNGGSIDSMNSSLENLSRTASESARGMGANVETFGILGVSVIGANGQIKDADVLLNDVSDSIARLGSQAERLEFAQKLGIGGDLLLTIQQGSEALNKQREEAKALGFVIDQDAADAAANFNDELLKVMRVIGGVASAIGTRLMKEITPMMKAFTEWFKINKNIIKQNLTLFLKKAIDIFKGVFSIVNRVVGIFLSLINAVGGLKNAIIVVTGLMLTLNATTLLMPILITAAAIGILLLLEDIIKFAEGGDSAIGQLAEKFPVLDAALRTTLDLMTMVRDGWIAIFTQGRLFTSDILDTIVEIGKSIQTFIIDNINRVIDLLNKIPDFGLLKKIFGIEDLSNLKGGSSETFESATTRLNAIRAERGGSLTSIGGATTNSKTSRTNIEININGGNPDEVKRVVTDVLNEQYSGAESNLESQVTF